MIFKYNLGVCSASIYKSFKLKLFKREELLDIANLYVHIFMLTTKRFLILKEGTHA